MKQSIYAVLVAVGTVIGSGFLSGKEIVVFFSRFGIFSFPCIFFAFFLFWGVFYFMMHNGERAIRQLENSKIANIINIFICIVISGAMFAGTFDIVAGLGGYAYMIMLALVFVSWYVSGHGTTSLGRISTFILPIMIILLVASEAKLIFCKSSLLAGQHVGLSLYYCVMYVIFNTCNSGVLMAHMSKNLSKKQKVQASFLSALILSVLLFLTNLVLLKNQQVFAEDMPLLALFDGGYKIAMQVVLFFGCVTTLLSLIFSLACSLRGLCGERTSRSLAILLPYLLSFSGFGFIVSQLYPLTSVFGAILIFELFLLPLFKKSNKIVHKRSKDT